ncbi:cell envelope integrity protein TolA [Suttonella sp. R2A3]|uniref:cell envelope integrity protein TolA n=1 Tax=Suttonella sp. R2A3 TaxID=2908648 RepID=UPI001F424B86|nr:cell envelope integrity protein TolA [Suttonella sp. R2A3]UJF24415.1 cell envelope integrity protein TolA [Suttonella sp. R2A3]
MSSRRFFRYLLENLAGWLMLLTGVALLLAVFWVGREMLNPSTGQNNPAGEPIQAQLVDGATLQRTIDQIEAKKQAEEDARLAAIRAEEEAKRRAEEEARRQKEAEEAAKREAAEEAARQKAQEQAAKEQAAEAAAAKKAAEEAAKKKAEEEAKQKAAEEAARQKAEEEAKKKAAEEAARQKAEEEAKKKAAEEAARKKAEEEAARKKAEEARQLEEKLAAMNADEPSLEGLQSSLQADADARDGSVYDSALSAYETLIERVTKRHYRLPDNTPTNLHAELVIYVNAQGNVLDVQVKRSSGYQQFDIAARNAVRDASPLPLPDYRPLRDDVIKEGILFKFNP